MEANDEPECTAEANLKIDCPHMPEETYRVEYAGMTLDKECVECSKNAGNHVCLGCRNTYCFEHMKAHYADAEHHIGFNLEDLSSYCFTCGEEVSGQALEGVFSYFADCELPDEEKKGG